MGHMEEPVERILLFLSAHRIQFLILTIVNKIPETN